MSKLFSAEPPSTAAKIGVLLLNLGTPESATSEAVRPFLREFLSDQRVVELPRWFWQLILHGMILPFRSKKSARAYQTIWQPKGSPLLLYTEQQTQALAQALHRQSQTEVVTAFAMTYGRHSVATVMADLKRQGVNQVLIVPLYPQYAASSTAAALDKVWRVLLRQRNQMAVRTIRSYYDDPGYITALAQKIKQHWQTEGRGDLLMMSFHGIPQAQHDQGDPYPLECRITATLLAQQLNLAENEYVMAYQSRFGPSRWVGPSTQELLVSLPKKGLTKLDVVCPGFAVDCLETLEEIAFRGRESFYAAGGKVFQYISCLNADDMWINALSRLVLRHLQGWLPETQ